MAWPGLARRALAPLMLVWLGIVVGVSLLAAPAPFMVEELARAEALAVNGQLFRVLSRAEIGLLVLLVLLALIGRPPGVLRLGLGALALIVIIQAGLLLPELARRTDLVLAGAQPPPGPAHSIYVGLELAKMTLLAVFALWRRAVPER